MWISLPNLPTYFWFEETINGIASIMGEYICMEKNTRSRKTFQIARFCANIDISKPMKTNIDLKNRREEYIQEISFDIPPTICVGCNRYGHTEKDYSGRLRK